MDKPKENEIKGKEMVQINMNVNEVEFDIFKERDLEEMPTEREVECESTSTLSIALKLILRYVEKCPLQVGSTDCGYYVMKFMREIVNKGSIVISNSAELDKVRVELADFLG
ncbi:uncharacterized protein E6C27_scaffold683G00040 [Cucumis melo var. makuwa]|uniref:Ubiquitin-like protease family profile domain-containing protein n=1 Tax=Cucumis melo var. makuwa TaxID=1194695 RepID=A0A5A7VB35_CUCMM|nr:uncharacterized protein E6C27_scaffold683G00040 [Cucumis melo var. makuwa]